MDESIYTLYMKENIKGIYNREKDVFIPDNEINTELAKIVAYNDYLQKIKDNEDKDAEVAQLRDKKKQYRRAENERGTEEKDEALMRLPGRVREGERECECLFLFLSLSHALSNFL